MNESYMNKSLTNITVKYDILENFNFGYALAYYVTT